MKKFPITAMMVRYLLKFAMRFVIFLGVFLFYFLDKPQMVEIMQAPISNGINFLHVIWLIFMLTMISHLFPREKVTMALLKGRSEKFVPDEKYQRVELLEYVHDSNIKAWKVMLVWLMLNAVVGLLYLLGILETVDLLMLTIFYYLSDYICILFFCPFQTLLMKNKCCVNCRIYDWGHFMMFTPMLFIQNFFSWSLFFTSCVVLIHWELVYAKHPERFWEGANRSLRCQNCKDKTCRIKNKISNRQSKGY